jgi:hypothetical protein
VPISGLAETLDQAKAQWRASFERMVTGMNTTDVERPRG